MEEVELPKKYANGKVVLKEPTVKIMTEISPDIVEAMDDIREKDDTGKLIDIIGGKKGLEILHLICEGGKEDINSLHPDVANEILNDFFTGWRPAKYYLENMDSLNNYLSSLPGTRRDTETSEES